MISNPRSGPCAISHLFGHADCTVRVGRPARPLQGVGPGHVSLPTSFGEDSRGELYVVTLNGQVYKLSSY